HKALSYNAAEGVAPGQVQCILEMACSQVSRLHLFQRRHNLRTDLLRVKTPRMEWASRWRANRVRRLPSENDLATHQFRPGAANFGHQRFGVRMARSSKQRLRRSVFGHAPHVHDHDSLPEMPNQAQTI